MTGDFSEFLNLLELRGASWCKVEIGSSGGFGAVQNEDLFFYAALKGCVRIAGIAGGTIQVQPGDVVLILSGEAHAVRNEPGAKLETIGYLQDGQYGDVPASYSIGSDALAVTRLLCGRMRVRWPSGLGHKTLPPALTLSAGETMVDAASMEKAAAGCGSAALLTRVASLMLTSALRSDPYCEQLFMQSVANDPIARALQMIERHAKEHWTVSTLAKHVGMGRSSFAARFAAEVGRTPMEVLADWRMRKAAEFLETSELKIADVGLRIGYLSEAAFSRRFTKHFGMSPGQMREHAKQHPKAQADDAGMDRYAPRMNAVSIACGPGAAVNSV